MLKYNHKATSSANYRPDFQQIVWLLTLLLIKKKKIKLSQFQQIEGMVSVLAEQPSALLYILMEQLVVILIGFGYELVLRKSRWKLNFVGDKRKF